MGRDKLAGAREEGCSFGSLEMEVCGRAQRRSWGKEREGCGIRVLRFARFHLQSGQDNVAGKVGRGGARVSWFVRPQIRLSSVEGGALW